MNNRLHKSIQQILLAGTTAAFTVGAVAALGPQNPPPGPGMQPDFFGVTPNYASSPQPNLATVTITDSFGLASGAVAAATTYDYVIAATVQNAYTGKIMDVQLVSGGSKYVLATTKVTVTGGPGSIPVTLTPIIVAGVIVGFAEIPHPTAVTDDSGTFYPAWVKDASGHYLTPGSTTVAWPGLGSGFTTPVAGTGLHKFVDQLSSLGSTPNGLGQMLPIAVPDTTSFPGSDYYEIAETTYTQKLHSDLPPTQLRGYVQLNAPAGSASLTNQYLGPVIVAQKDRPVRIKLVNQLGIGAKGNLPFPVDKSYMGSTGATDTDNRTALHLHGGNTPWISDGTPRQWVKPAREAGNNRGVSAVNVPDMWFDSTGKVVPIASMTAAAAANPAAAGYSNDPGPGTLTFFFTNQQSQRLMFYHDHAEGVTRLNVYAGMAAGYVLTDPTEQAMTNGGTVTYNYLDPVTKAPLDTPISKTYAQVLPTDVIPLVIQEKTFVPDNTTPVLNYFGPFTSQLNSQDPTWGWGSGVAATGLNGPGDLWVPHVYMTNQNPGDTTGANALGRWDYGSWFWPPVSSLTYPAANNAYADPLCVSSASQLCESATIPGMDSGAGGKFVSATPEAFNDTPLVNGTVYPYVNVSPKKYRLRMLSVGNDRILNLSMVVAASKNSPNTTADGNASSNAAAATNTILCDGTTGVNQADCTEVRMLPFNSVQNIKTPFPAWWYTVQKGGVTFDGRPSGVFDPATRGPAMVQIGNEGGFLSTPAVIRNQPVNFEYNLKNIVVTNIKEHALLLGPAERADVVVDFSQFAGSTIILYNDAPAPAPAFDLRLDYFTGDYDNTDTGGSFSTLPGYGPNNRTIMQFRVAADCSADTTGNCGVATGGINLAPVVNASKSQDFVDPAQVVAPATAAYGLNAATAGSLVFAVQTAFKYSQDEIIVPQAAYNPVYGTTVADAMGADISRISDTQLTFTPFSVGMTGTLEAAPVTMGMGPKAIHELFTTDYGRMNALLAIEIPNTNFTVQTTVPQYYVDPPTELVKIAPNDGTPITDPANFMGNPPLQDPINQLGDGTQLWRITHNGVDSHAIHFHLFNLQVVNRVGWDGMIRMPDANELGWKETVRMNPLEDVVVALRPKKMLKTSELTPLHPSTDIPYTTFEGMDFKVPNSHRHLDPSNSGAMAFYNLDPLTGNASTNVTSNPSMNFGWEYVWHCHILGHEENDMMRSIAVAQAPEAPTGLTATTNATAGVDLKWTDNSIIANWVTIQRATDVGLKNDSTNPATGNPITTIYVPTNECALQAGCAVSYTDTTAAPYTTYYYNLVANNTVGAGDANGRILSATLAATLTPNALGYDNVTASSTPATGSIILNPTASVTAGPLAFGNQLVNTASAVQNVTVSNTGKGNLAIASVALTTGTNYTLTNGCPTTLAPAASCTVGVTFKPTATGPLADTLTITDNTGGVVGTKQTVALSGTGTAPVASVSGALAFGNQLVNTTSAAQTVTLSNSGTAALSIASVTPTGSFAVASNTCGTSLAAGANCTIGVTFTPTAAGNATGSLTITDNNGGVNGSTQVVTLTGTSNAPVASVSPAGSLAFGNFVLGQVSAAQTVTLSNTGNVPLAIASIVAPASFAQTNTCPASLAAGANCSISVTFKPTAATAASGNLVITDNTGGVTGKTQTVALSGTGVNGRVVTVTPGPLAFSAANRATSAAQTVTIANAGNQALSFTGGTPIKFTGGNTGQFGLTTTCGATLAANSSCTVSVTFSPTSVGTKTTALTIADNGTTATGAANTAQSVTLTGIVLVPTGTMSPATVAFGNVTRGTTSASQAVTLTNTSTLALTIKNIVLGAPNPGQFVLGTNNCGATLNAGSSCTINVSFKPGNGQAKGANLSAALNVTSNSSPAIPAVTLTGTAN